MTLATLGLTMGLKSEAGGGMWWTMDRAMSRSVAPSNGRRRVRVSKATTPNEKMSERGEGGFISTCSGAM
jgi:hypothetical protein